MDAKQRIARRVAQELRDGDVVNLGIGLPTMVANYLPADIHITLQSENGFLGLGRSPPPIPIWSTPVGNRVVFCPVPQCLIAPCHSR